MPVKCSTISMKGTEYPHLKAMLFGPLQQCVCGKREQIIEQCRVGFENGPQLARHGERDVLMLTVRHDIKLSVYPLLSGFVATRAASLCLAALADDLSVWTVWCAAIVVFGTHQVSTASQHAFYACDLPKTEGMGMFPQHLLPSVVFFKQELCGARDKFFWVWRRLRPVY